MSFGRDTKSRWSLLSGVYARGVKDPTRGINGCVTCSGLTNSHWTLRGGERRGEERRGEERRGEERRGEERDETRRDETRRDETRRDETRRDETDKILGPFENIVQLALRILGAIHSYELIRLILLFNLAP